MTDQSQTDNSLTTPTPNGAAPSTQQTPTQQNSPTTSQQQNPPPTPTDTPAKNPDGSLLTDGTKDPAAAAPETYAEFKLPEGFKLSEEGLKEATDLFKELNLPQEAAQKIVDKYAAQAMAAAEAPFEAYNAMRDGWRKEVIADKTLGNGKDGLAPEAASIMAKAIDALGDLAPDFRKAIALTGAGDNPAFLRGFYALAQKFTEGRPTTVGKPSPHGQRDPSKAAAATGAAAMYPNLPTNSAG